MLSVRFWTPDSIKACRFYSRFRTEPGNKAIDYSEYVVTPDNGTNEHHHWFTDTFLCLGRAANGWHTKGRQL